MRFNPSVAESNSTLLLKLLDIEPEQRVEK